MSMIDFRAYVQSDDTIAALARISDNVKEISIHSDLTQGPIIQLFDACPKLQRFRYKAHVLHLTNANDTMLMINHPIYPNMTLLALDTTIPASSLEALLKLCPNLRMLSIHNIRHNVAVFSRYGSYFSMILALCPQITQLHCAGWHRQLGHLPVLGEADNKTIYPHHNQQQQHQQRQHTTPGLREFAMEVCDLYPQNHVMQLLRENANTIESVAFTTLFMPVNDEEDEEDWSILGSLDPVCLRKLSLTQVEMSADALSELLGKVASTVDTVELDQMPVTVQVADAFQPLDSLRHLYINARMTPEAATHLAKSLRTAYSTIESLGFQQQITNDILRSIGCLERLETLDLCNGRGLDGGVLCEMLECLRPHENLTMLKLTGCRAVSDRVLDTISKFKSVRRLILLGSMQCTDAGLIRLCHALSSTVDHIFITGRHLTPHGIASATNILGPSRISAAQAQTRR